MNQTVTVNVKYQYTSAVYGDIFSAWTQGGQHEEQQCVTRDQATEFVSQVRSRYEQEHFITRTGEPVKFTVAEKWN